MIIAPPGSGKREIIVTRVKWSVKPPRHHILGQLITSEKKGQYVYYALNFDYLIIGLKGLTALLENNASKERKE